MISVGVAYSVILWCQFVAGKRQKKIATFMAVLVSLATASLFVFAGVLWAQAFLFLSNVWYFQLDFEYRYRQYHHSQKMFNTSIWNKIHIAFDCCGAANYTDWTRLQRDLVPDSCCKTYSPGCGRNFSLANIIQTGCLGNLEKHVKLQYLSQTQEQKLGVLLLMLIFFRQCSSGC